MPTMQSMLESGRRLLESALEIWSAGGWAMYAIAVVALVLFGLGTSTLLRMRSKGFHRVPERTWRRWIDHPAERRGPVGRLIEHVDGATTVDETIRHFEHVRALELAPFARDLRILKVCVSAAPLLGLLGTVTGMLATFGALASGSGGEKTMAMVADGISEALITTETGLVIAIPGLFLQYHLSRRYETFKAFLAHLETVCAQVAFKRGDARRSDEARVAA